MAEFAAVISLTASIVQLIDASNNVCQRIKKFRHGTTFKDLHAQLPVLQQTLERIQTAQSRGLLDSGTQKVLPGAIVECAELITDLDAIITRLTPAVTNSKLQRGYKCLRSFGEDSRIQDIQVKLDRSVSRLSCYFSVDSSISCRDAVSLLTTTSSAASSAVSSCPADAVFFEVPALQVSQFVGRA